MKLLINVDELSDIMKKDENFVIFDCRFDLFDKNYGPDSYADGHIEGAYLIDVEKDLTDEVSEHGGRHPFKNRDDLIEILKGFGVDNDTTVIAYDDGDMQGACRLVYQLINLGHDRVCALDGGFAAYTDGGGVVEKSVNVASGGGGAFTPVQDDSLFVDVDYVRDRIGDPDTVIIDSRSSERYQGFFEPVDSRAGHIPGAVNYFFAPLINEDTRNGSFKDIAFIEERFADLDRDKEIIVYCGSGISASVNAVALDLLGFDYKIYPGSFSDWISYPDNEIECGSPL